MRVMVPWQAPRVQFDKTTLQPATQAVDPWVPITIPEPEPTVMNHNPNPTPPSQQTCITQEKEVDNKTSIVEQVKAQYQLHHKTASRVIACQCQHNLPMPILDINTGEILEYQ